MVGDEAASLSAILGALDDEHGAAAVRAAV